MTRQMCLLLLSLLGLEKLKANKTNHANVTELQTNHLPVTFSV